MKKLLIGLAALLLVVLAGCGPKETGTLTGTVTIGPLTPVQTENVTPTVPCSVYEARKVVILDRGGKRQLQVVDIDCEGRYAVALAAGAYTVDINHLGIDRAAGLPAQVNISANQTTRLDISIDTGIR